MISKIKRSSFQKRHEIRCQSTKITKLPVPNTNSGLDLHSSSSESVNFFGAHSSLGGHNFRFGGTSSYLGGHGPGMPPRGAGPGTKHVNFRAHSIGSFGHGCNVPQTRQIYLVANYSNQHEIMNNYHNKKSDFNNKSIKMFLTFAGQSFNI